MVKLIAIYNYKGGVAKTTNVINLASALTISSKPSKVLVIDADPQCNTTTFYLENEEDESMEADEEIQNDTNEEEDVSNETLTDNNIRDLPAMNHDELSPKAEPHDLNEVRMDNTQPNLYNILFPVFLGQGLTNLTPIELKKNLLWLIPGHADIVRFEKHLSQSENIPLQGVMWNGAFRKVVMDIAKGINADFVLVDLGPSSGVINKVFVMSCDYILPPAFADFYSLSSVDGLLRTLLPTWFQWREQEAIRGEMEAKNAHSSILTPYVLPKRLPRILPFTITSYRMYNKCITKPSSRWILDLKRLIADPTIPEIVRKQYLSIGGEMLIPLYRHVGQLMQHSHAIRVSILEFNEEICRDHLGIRPDHAKGLVTEVKKRYFSLCKRLRMLPGFQ